MRISDWSSDVCSSDLHGCISERRHPVTVPEAPVYLDALLIDTPLTAGLEPMLGKSHVRTLSVLGFPNMSRPGILDTLNHQDFAYRWVWMPAAGEIGRAHV